MQVLLPDYVSDAQLAYLLMNLQYIGERGDCGDSCLPFLSILVSLLLEHGEKLFLVNTFREALLDRAGHEALHLLKLEDTHMLLLSLSRGHPTS